MGRLPCARSFSGRFIRWLTPVGGRGSVGFTHLGPLVDEPDEPAFKASQLCGHVPVFGQGKQVFGVGVYPRLERVKGALGLTLRRGTMGVVCPVPAALIVSPCPALKTGVRN
jgi:hypothetical protein